MAQQAQEGRLERLPLEQVRPDPENLRELDTEGEEWERLVESVREGGVLTPVIVAQVGDDYVLVDGHRRRAAAEAAGLSDLPATVRSMTQAERTEAMLVTALHRRDLSPVEEARGYFRLVELGNTAAALARKVGRSSSHVSARLDLLRLPDEVLPLVNLEQAAHLVRGMDAGLSDADLVELAQRPAGVAWRVDDLVKARRREAAVEKVLDKVRRSGHPHVVRESRDQRPTWAALADLGLADDDAAHAGEPCHGVLVDLTGAGKPEVSKVCVEPARHRPRGESPVKSPAAADEPGAEQARAERERRRAEREREEAARRARLERLALATRAARPADADAAVRAALVARASSDAVRRAAAVLGTEPVTVPDPHGATRRDGQPREQRDHREELRRAAEGSAAAGRRVALAVALAMLEVEPYSVDDARGVLEALVEQAAPAGEASR